MAIILHTFKCAVFIFFFVKMVFGIHNLENVKKVKGKKSERERKKLRKNIRGLKDTYN